ncbi:hypothetical protein [Streptomyces sp. NPDC093105]|uniref:hypothetical protein n=1 Tax=Streptomyces sp. NPDC093105 TaxID=3366029 RepID=UPI0038058D41
MDRPIEHDELLAFLHRLAWADTGELRCRGPGHADGHLCLTPPAGEVAFDALRRALVERYGRARNLAPSELPGSGKTPCCTAGSRAGACAGTRRGSRPASSPASALCP